MLLFVYAILSWLPGGYQSKFGQLISRICEPYLSLFDRWNLHIGMIDFTIMAAMFVLNLASEALIRIVSQVAYMIFF